MTNGRAVDLFYLKISITLTLQYKKDSTIKYKTIPAREILCHDPVEETARVIPSYTKKGVHRDPVILACHHPYSEIRPT